MIKLTYNYPINRTIWWIECLLSIDDWTEGKSWSNAFPRHYLEKGIPICDCKPYEILTLVLKSIIVWRENIIDKMNLCEVDDRIKNINDKIEKDTLLFIAI